MLQLSGGISRRRFLQRGAALGAFALPPGAWADTGERGGARAKAVIVLLLEGGMSHLESWDPKPDAPDEVRGSFGQIATTNPELSIGEHLPLLAQQAHLYNVVRSVYMDNRRRDHSPGLHWVLTGYDNQAAGVSLMRENTHPSVGAVVAHCRGTLGSEGVPNFVAVPNQTQLGGRVNYARAVHLGAGCEPFDAGSIPERADAEYVVPAGLVLPRDVSVRRLEDRRTLNATFDRLQNEQQRLAAADELSGYQQQVFDLLLGQRGREAFDINQESATTRSMYGDSRMGQGTLLARRLVEAGASYVLVNYSKNNSWDTHGDNFSRLKNDLLPPMDRATSALLIDLEQRGLLDDVLVLQLGEMGRTPLINKNAGRDHWPDVFSLMAAGGGLTRGQVLGSSTRTGETPSERAVHYHEILATVYSQLGIDPHLMLADAAGREIRILPPAEAVGELVGG